MTSQHYFVGYKPDEAPHSLGYSETLTHQMKLLFVILRILKENT